MALAACAPEPAGTPPRTGRFGSLRDFVLFERPDAREPSFFIDRFEVTRGDWREFAATDAGRAVDADSVILLGDAALPAGRVDLRQARAFAAWRFARLPRRDEWMFAAVGDGPSPYPWGFSRDPTCANTGELGLGEPVAVGTFESGRRPGRDQPYDLIGNVSEWTESVPLDWWDNTRFVDVELGDGRVVSLPEQVDPLDPLASSSILRQRVLSTPALAVWQQAGGLMPLLCLVQAGGDQVPREVVGADFSTKMTATVEAVCASDRRDRTGLRVCAGPRGLLRALATQATEVREQDLEQLRRFVLRGRHRAVLAAAWPAVKVEIASAPSSAPVVRVLEELLGTPDAASGGR